MGEAPLPRDVWRRRRSEILGAVHASGGFGSFLDADGRLHVMARPTGSPQVLAAVAEAVTDLLGQQVPIVARDPDEVGDMHDLGRLFDQPDPVVPIAAKIERLRVRWHGEGSDRERLDRQMTYQLQRADLDVDELQVLAARLAARVGDADELDEATSDAVEVMAAAWSLGAGLRAARHWKDTYQHATSQLVHTLYVRDRALLNALLDVDALPGNEFDFGLRDDELMRFGGDPATVPWVDPAEVATFLDDRFDQALQALERDRGSADG